MKTIRQIYSKDDYEIQLKAPILQTMLFVLVPAGIMAALTNLVQGKPLPLILYVVLTCVLAVSIFILRKGDYGKSSSITVYSIAIVFFLANLVSGYTGEHVVLNKTLLMVLVVILSMFFSIRTLHLLVHEGIAIVSVFGFIAYMLVAKIYTTLSVSLLNQLVAPMIVLPIVCVLSYFLRNIMEKVISDARARMQVVEEQARHLEALAAEASDKLVEAQSMNSQAEETAASVAEIEQSVGNIQGNVGRLTSQYNTSLDSLTIISEKMMSLDTVADNQSANITEISAALEEMVASIKNVSGVIESKMVTVRQLTDTADNGSTVIQNTTLSFKEVLDHLDNVRQMISIISGISSQTNLLAMNAAIEAAHAGDAGRGFAVVADEVRKLAESSSVSAKKVSQTLKELIQAIETAGSNVNKSGESFTVIGSEVKLVGEAIQEINASVKELAAGSDEILTATGAMNELTVQVSDAVRDVTQNQNTVKVNVDGMGSFVQTLDNSISEINTGTGHILEAAHELKDKASHINSFVQEFSHKLKVRQ